MVALQEIALGGINLIFACVVYYGIYSGFRKLHVMKYGEKETLRVVQRDTGWNGNWFDYLRTIILPFILIFGGIQYVADLII